MQNSILESVVKDQYKKRPKFSVGDKVTVHVRLKEGDKERVQPFRGVVLTKVPKSGKGIAATFTVRKVSDGVGVERVFPVHSPNVEKIEVHASSEVRRSRLYFLRRLSGKKARLKSKESFDELVVKKPEPVVEEAVALAPEGEKTEGEAQAKAPEAKEASKDSDKPAAKEEPKKDK